MWPESIKLTLVETFFQIEGLCTIKILNKSLLKSFSKLDIFNLSLILSDIPIKLQIDDNDPLDLNYAYCNQSACFVAEIIGENFVNFFKAGNQIVIKALFLDNREATITYSLSGFTAGYNRLYSSLTN